MPDDLNSIEELAKRFSKLNADLLRDIMSSHFIRFEKLEFSQGRLTKAAPAEKHYKNIEK